MAEPVYTVELGLAANPLDALSTITWTDISTDSISFSISQGRNHELGQCQAGTCDLTVEDVPAAKFDPANSLGAYYPNLKPMKRVRVRATYAADPTDYLFTGFIDSFRVRRKSADFYDVEISATDAFKLLNLWQLKEPYFAEVMADSPLSYFRFNETGQPLYLADSSGNKRHGTIHNPVVSDEGFLEGYQLGEIGATVGGTGVHFWDTGGYEGSQAQRGYAKIDNIGVSGTSSWTMTFYARAEHIDTNIPALLVIGDSGHYRPATGTAFSLMPVRHIYGLLSFEIRVSVNSVLTLDAVFTSPLNYDARPFPRYTLSRNGATFSLDLDGVTVDSATASASPSLSSRLWIATGTEGAYVGYVPFAGYFDELSVFAGVLSSTRDDAQRIASNNWLGDKAGDRFGHVFDQIGWPSADRSFETGHSNLQAFAGGESALSHLQLAAKTEDGLFFIDGAGKPTLYGRHHLLTNARSTVVQAVFGDGGGSEIAYTSGVDPVLGEEDLWNRVVMQAEGGMPQIASDQTSITSYGERTLSESGLLALSDNDMADRAAFRKSIYKNPYTRVRSVPIEWDGSDALFYPAALRLGLWDRVEYKQRLPNASVYSQESLIEGIKRSYTSDPPRLKVTFALSPAEAIVSITAYGVVGTSLVGTAVAAY